jgi:CRISPR-associated protein Cas1
VGKYRAMPLKSLHIPKKPRLNVGEVPKTEWRGLGVPTVRDRIVQQALLNLLHPILEGEFEECSFAYRPGRSYKAAVRQVQQWHDRGYEHVLDADVVKYFDNVQHRRLLSEFQERVHDPKAGKLVEQWMKSGVYTASGLVLPQKGIPQGSVVSPILANVYFDDFDEAILGAGLKLGSVDISAKFNQQGSEINQAQEIPGWNYIQIKRESRILIRDFTF